MEKFTFRSTYSEASLYARWTASAASGAPAAKPPAGTDGQAVPAEGQASGSEAAARNADGDTFTLSLEARAIQVSESLSIETRSVCGKAAGTYGPSRAGRLEALMEALDRRHAHGDRLRRYPSLADADDVAARASEAWDREFPAGKGSRRDFAEAIRARLDRWAAGGGEAGLARFEHREFRSEVAIRISVRLEAWAGSGPARGES